MTTPPEPRHYPAPPKPEPRSYPFTVDAAPPDEHSPSDTASTTSSIAVAWRVVSFVIGCVLLALCAWAIGDRVPQWTRDYGSILVFLVLFLVMPLAGRWFWIGVDTAISTIRGGRR